MLRFALILAGLFALPFVGYAIATLLGRRGSTLPVGRDGRPGLFVGAPFQTLVLIGLVLVVAGLLGLSAFRDAPLGKTYVPDQFKDGKLVPGYFE